VTLANFYSDGKEDNDSDKLNNLHSAYFNIGGKEVRVVFCDISKAFDRVWYNGLLTKLKSIGIQGPLLSWIKKKDYSNFLSVVECLTEFVCYI
jgi:hypothetical protein